MDNKSVIIMHATRSRVRGSRQKWKVSSKVVFLAGLLCKCPATKGIHCGLVLVENSAIGLDR